MNITQTTENNPVATIVVASVIGVAGTAFAVHIAPRVAWRVKEAKRNLVEDIKSWKS